jgi:GDPmannose 4,6-dehydratase
MKKKIVLITGVMGQDGSYLSEFLLKKKYIVIGGYNNFNNWRHIKLKINKKINYEKLDITKYNNIKNILQKYKINEIYNLAGQSKVRKSNLIPKKTILVNSIGILNILENIKNYNNDIKLYQACSAEIYGNFKGKIINEKSKFSPETIYASSKLFSYNLTKNYRENFGLYACCGILFNHESPLREEEFVSKKIIRGINQIFLKKKKIIEIGNLETKRDWGYAKDYVKAMWLMMQQKKPDDYIVATGKVRNLKYLIEKTCSKFKIKVLWKKNNNQWIGINKSNNKVIIVSDRKLFSPYDVRNYKANISKIKKIGWLPKTNIDKLINIMVKDEKKFY